MGGSVIDRVCARYAASVSYDGSLYHGWQRLQEKRLPTVQEAVESALERIANHSCPVFCAGRTDAGVHATRQIIHFESYAVRDHRRWLSGTNHHLPEDIALNWVMRVPSDFHARYSAIARRYLYVVYNGPIQSPHVRHLATWRYGVLDIQKMQEAAHLLLGEHDFNAYRAAQCQARHAVRTLLHFHIERKADTVIFDIQANAFLHHMVRNMVGVLMEIGIGKKPPSWAQQVLQSRDRRCGGVTAPAQGLYLVDVLYADRWQLPQEKIGPSFMQL